MDSFSLHTPHAVSTGLSKQKTSLPLDSSPPRLSPSSGSQALASFPAPLSNLFCSYKVLLGQTCTVHHQEGVLSVQGPVLIETIASRVPLLGSKDGNLGSL